MKKTEATSGHNKWAVIFSYFGVAAMSQMLWLNLAPLTAHIREIYAVSDMQIGLLLLSFPLVYLLLSVHAGGLISRRGYRTSILFGGSICVASSFLRIPNGHFSLLFIGEIGIAIGQPYIINSISALVQNCFDEKQVSLASGIATAGQLFGMAVGLGLTPILHLAYGFSATMGIASLISAVCVLAFFWMSRSKRQMLPDQATFKYSTINQGQLIQSTKLFANRNFIFLCLAWFFAFGCFNALSVWMEEILGQHGFSAADSGIAGACMILGGFLGSLLIPSIAEALELRRGFLILSCTSALLTIWPICSSTSPVELRYLCFAFGFLFLPGYPLVLKVCDCSFPAEQLSKATSILMLFGNAGAITAIGSIPVIHFLSSKWDGAVALLISFSGVAVLLAILLPKDIFKQQRLAS
jgi:cyanate permease